MTPTNTPTDTYSKDVALFSISQDGELSLITSTNLPAEIIIPKFVNETTVTSLEEAIFQDCTTIVKVTVNGQIAQIPELAFYGCTSLTDVILEDGVTNIFSQVSNLG